MIPPPCEDPDLQPWEEALDPETSWGWWLYFHQWHRRGMAAVPHGPGPVQGPRGRWVETVRSPLL